MSRTNHHYRGDAELHARLERKGQSEEAIARRRKQIRAQMFRKAAEVDLPEDEQRQVVELSDPIEGEVFG